MVMQFIKSFDDRTFDIMKWLMNAGIAAVMLYLVLRFGMDQYEKTADNERAATMRMAESYDKATEYQRQTATALTELSGLSKALLTTTKAVVETQAQACTAAKAAETSAAFAAAGVGRTNQLLSDSARLQSQSLAALGELAELQKSGDKCASEERKAFWENANKMQGQVLQSQTTILVNQGKIIDALSHPVEPKKPQGDK
jgi:hypothetical protein